MARATATAVASAPVPVVRSSLVLARYYWGIGGGQSNSHTLGGARSASGRGLSASHACGTGTRGHAYGHPGLYYSSGAAGPGVANLALPGNGRPGGAVSGTDGKRRQVRSPLWAGTR